jgi:hypothetical protein
MFTQLNPPLPVYVMDRGNGVAHGVIDYGPEHDLIWVVFLNSGGECWSVPNPSVRGQYNTTMGRVPALSESNH